MNTESRLIELETKIAFQDKLLEELNGVIYRQQLTIDELEKKINEMQKRLADDINSAHVPPPHY